jgi:MSHA biogenesis protein MshP
MKKPRFPQAGFAAIAAVFLVVMLAAFGAFMVSFSNTQQLNSAQDVQGSRAYWAARAGLEWAIASLGVGATACWASTPPASIDGFTLAVSCAASSFTEGTSTVYVFRLNSVASTGTVGSVGFIESSVSASVER